MTTDTHALLKAYAETRSEDAFREIVDRYVGLVYATALRQVDGDSHLAEDLSQVVFSELAKHAGSLSADTRLGGWLYQRTFNVARTRMRSERRRVAREREVANMTILEDHTPSNLSQIGPALDDALMQLHPADRAAITIRYFERSSLGTVGEALGVNEDTAQKRVSRALDKLRLILHRMGVTLTASALTALLASEGAKAAPAGVAATITSSVISPASSIATTLGAASQTLAMTTIQKTLGTAVIAALATIGLFQSVRIAQLNREKNTQRREQAEHLRVLQNERDALARQVDSLAQRNEWLTRNQEELARLRGRISAAKSDAGQKGSAAEASLTSWLGRVKKLKQFPILMPAMAIPELTLLTEEDWLELAKQPLEHDASEVNLDDEATSRMVFSAIRAKAKDKVMRKLVRALNHYVAANDGFLPKDIAQLQPYITKSTFLEAGHVEEVPDLAVDEAMLQRYAVVQSGKMEAVPPENVIIIAERAPVDERFDTRVEIGKHWMCLDNDLQAYHK